MVSSFASIKSKENVKNINFYKYNNFVFLVKKFIFEFVLDDHSAGLNMFLNCSKKGAQRSGVNVKKTKSFFVLI